jgi:choline dehydrogenase-like flavoprotein
LLNCVATIGCDFPEDSAVGVLKEIVRAGRAGKRTRFSASLCKTLASGLSDVAHTAFRRFALGRSPGLKPSRIFLQCHTEQVPNPQSRVTLSDVRDALGVPRIRIDWKLHELERKTMHATTSLVGEEFQRLGLGRVVPAAWITDQKADWRSFCHEAYHHAGTTRMADDPSRGVVDRDCKVFHAEGLYVASGAVFPASGYANPTLTIAALAIRLADHLKAKVLRS